MTCEETALSLGAYVLGALEPEERRAVREHRIESGQVPVHVV